MPITPHVDCTEPPAKTPICRFIDLPKLRDLFANEELYFRRTELFKETDLNEALSSDECTSDQRVVFPQLLAAFRRRDTRYVENIWERRRSVFTFRSIEGAARAHAGQHYVGHRPLRQKDMTGYNFIRFLYTKRRLFERERERRVVIQCYDPVGGANRHYNLNSFPNREPLDELNPLHPWVHECKRRRIDLKALLTEVRLSPWATTEESEEVKLRVRGKNFPGPVTPLDLRSPLTPTLDELRRHGG